ncbi:MAG: DUF86 domain-containing protein [Planctomycetes bacterium]|nr:DUF86 domain-containing protein [Planctomycetota bacterium]
MKKREYRDYLQDILDSIKDVQLFIGKMKYEKFLTDKKTVNAVVRSIEIIGEAAKHLPGSFRNKYPAVPWKKMAGMRDKLAHEYFGIDLSILWQTINEDIPPLEPKIKLIIS